MNDLGTRINIGAMLSKRAAISPGREVFVEYERERRFTFSELNQRCNRAAQVLLQRGLKPGDRVATLLKNGIEFVETYFAAAKIGCVLVPVNWRLAEPEIRYILEDAGAAALVYDADFDEAVEGIRSGSACPEAIASWLRVSVDGSAPADGVLDYDQAVVTASDEEPPLGAWDDDLIFIMYTSGTTGHPKGVMHSHDALLWSHLTSITTSDMRGDDRYLLALPMFHVATLNPVSLVVHRGASAVIMRDLDMAAMFQCIDREKVSIFTAVPALLQFMLHAPERESCDLASVRWVATGAAPVPVSLLQDYENAGIAIYQAYGLTESCGPGTLLLPEDAETRVGSCGRPQMHTEAKIVDESGATIPMGSDQAGELLLAGRHLMKGYWNNPEATAERIRPCPALAERIGDEKVVFSGDYVRADEDGILWFESRADAMIKCSGHRLSPTEVEEALYESGCIGDAVVFGVADDELGQVVHAAVTAPSETSELDLEALLRHCRDTLPNYMVPRQVHPWPGTFPRTSSGKFDRPAIRSACLSPHS